MKKNDRMNRDLKNTRDSIGRPETGQDTEFEKDMGSSDIREGKKQARKNTSGNRNGNR